ncbi:MAG: UPF0182 family protein [Ilumatobacter sp.]|nr:MAG: UPF0182 family protein [Ilumatobacter sp.]
MRRSTDLPSQPRSRRLTGRAVLIGLGLLFFLFIVFGRAIARFYVDFLWHDGLGRTDVFWGVLFAQLTLFAVFFLVFVGLAVLNLYLADRAAPTSFPANVHPYVERFHEVFGHRLRLVRYGTALLLGLVIALPAAARWQDWLLFRNSQSFGIADEQFGVDVGFYVFQLPFLSFAIEWTFAALVIVILLTLAAHLLNGGVVFTSSMPAVRASTKAHLAVLLALLAVVKAADYWVTRYDLTNERRGFVQGATYAVVNAQLPALMLLTLIALLTAGLYLSTIKTNSWRIPLVASALWLVVSLLGGVIYPAVVQSLVVRPNQAAREAPFIDRNMTATRQSMGLGDNLDQIVEVPREFSPLSGADVEADLEPLQRVRLLNPTEFQSRFRVDRGELAGLAIQDLDVDRYELDGELEQVLIAARELDLAGVANQSWQGRTLVNTRGCGLVMAPVSRVQASDRPDYRDVPLDRPELYFSPTLTGYGIANTAESERACGGNEPYSGTSGVRMSSLPRRAAFALAFLDYNIIGSGAIGSESQMLWVRGVRDRVDKLAPFLSYDGDPYPVALDGRVVWVIDAYSTTDRYPYGQRIGNVQLTSDSGVPRGANYIRNSVKAVVDAYTGDITFYVIDEDDPVVMAWWSAFPDLFTSFDEMPQELREHLRYPEDLFRIQTDVYSKYRLAPENFFQRVGAWSIAQAPSAGPRQGQLTNTGDPEVVTATEFAVESDAARFTPYYSLFRNGVTGELEFALLRPFVPFSRDDQRTELEAFMTVSSDPDTYGQFTSYIVTGGRPDGPIRVASQAESEPAINREISLLDAAESGTAVRFGDLQLVPVGDGLIYVRPFYVEVQQSGPIPLVTEYRFVIVSHGERAAHAPTMGQALARVFPGLDVDLGDRVGSDGSPVDFEEVADFIDPFDEDFDELDIDDNAEPPVNDTPERPPVDPGADAAELLAEAEALFTEAELVLRSTGDLGQYQATITEAREMVARALEIIAVG